MVPRSYWSHVPNALPSTGCTNTRGSLEKFVDSPITQSRNFVEVRWRSLFRSTSLGKHCTSYNALPTSRKRAADRLSFRNFLLRSSLFMNGKAQKSHGTRSELYGGCSNGVPPIHFSRPDTEFNSDLVLCDFLAFPIMKWSSEARNFEVINGLQHVFEKWVERCKKCIACQGRNFKKETVTAPPQSSDSE
jgi:hypothetical protein